MRRTPDGRFPGYAFSREQELLECAPNLRDFIDHNQMIIPELDLRRRLGGCRGLKEGGLPDTNPVQANAGGWRYITADTAG